MRELVFNTGGRKLFNDDLRDLQDLAKSFESLYADYEPFAVSGLAMTRVSGNTYNIGRGYVWLGGRLRLFDGASNVDLSTPKFINVRDSEESREYNDTAQKTAVVNYGCVLSTTTLGAVNSLRIEAGGRVRRYVSDVLGSQLLLLNPVTSLQTVSGNVRFSGNVTVSGTTTLGTVNADNVKAADTVSAEKSLTLAGRTVSSILNSGSDLSANNAQLAASGVIKAYVDKRDEYILQMVQQSASASDANLLGFIQMYSGPLAGRFDSTGRGIGAYSDWAICNGQNGTPDLRDRFIVGAGGKYAPDVTGGAETVTLSGEHMPNHSHGAGDLRTGWAGTHSHAYSDVVHMESGYHSNHGLDGSVNFGSNKIGSGDTDHDNKYGYYRRVQTAEDGGHTHLITGNTAAAGGGQPHENRPPFYALYYIMKIA